VGVLRYHGGLGADPRRVRTVPTVGRPMVLAFSYVLSRNGYLIYADVHSALYILYSVSSQVHGIHADCGRRRRLGDCYLVQALAGLSHFPYGGHGSYPGATTPGLPLRQLPTCGISSSRGPLYLRMAFGLVSARRKRVLIRLDYMPPCDCSMTVNSRFLS
jgi:hypothetical protein